MKKKNEIKLKNLRVSLPFLSQLIKIKTMLLSNLFHFVDSKLIQNACIALDNIIKNIICTKFHKYCVEVRNTQLFTSFNYWYFQCHVKTCFLIIHTMLNCEIKCLLI